MESDLAATEAKLKEALERVQVVHQAMSVDLPRVAEVWSLSFFIPWCKTVILVHLLFMSQDLEMRSIRKS